MHTSILTHIFANVNAFLSVQRHSIWLQLDFHQLALTNSFRFKLFKYFNLNYGAHFNVFSCRLGHVISTKQPMLVISIVHHAKIHEYPNIYFVDNPAHKLVASANVVEVR